MSGARADGHRTRGTAVPVNQELLGRQVVGDVGIDRAAGQPLPVMSSEDSGWTEPMETLELANSQAKGERDLYALRVRGTSMIDALIDDGDVVVLRPATDARNGDMVAAWLKQEQEATLKRFYLEGKNVRLQPANSQMEPIIVPAANVEIKGRVVAVIRRLE